MKYSRALVSTVFLLCGAALCKADVAPSAQDVRPLLIGAEVPEVTLHDLDGKPAALREVVAQKPTLIIFYRGGW